MNPKKPNRCLIVAPSWVGDMIMAQSALKWIKTHSPETEIHVLANSWIDDVLTRIPEIDRIVHSPFQHGQLALIQRYQFAKTLRAHHYQHAIVFPNSFKSALIPFWANIPKRTGFIGECRYGVLNDWRRLRPQQTPRMVDRFMQLVVEKNDLAPAEFDYPKLKINLSSAQQLLHAHHFPTNGSGIIALAAGAAFGSAKRWPVTHFIQLSRSFLQHGFTVCLLGSNSDCDIINLIEHDVAHPYLVNLAGKLKLHETIDLLSQCKALVSNDSGLLHIASALHIPVIGIYGPTAPDFAPPLTPHHAIITAIPKLSCQPCKQRDCPLKHHACMQNIDAKRVFDTCLTLMAAHSS